MKSLRYSKKTQGLGLGAGASCPEPRAQSPEQGFSLIELLIASVVAAAAGALLVGALVAVNRNTELRTERVLSIEALASQLALLDDQLAPKTPTSGTCNSPVTRCEWTLTWNQTSLRPLVEATITVAHKDRTNHVVTYRPIAEP